ncbi:type I restriction-modification system subunit M [Actinotalea lenta]|uniref:type I restriction-modification system subunit M n=1 Tax=Actinotalea lenta TaxID=3064654 RepID=UPI00331308DB
MWTIADQLRGVFKPHQYGSIILPFTVLRRLDCIMEPHRPAMQSIAERRLAARLALMEAHKQTRLWLFNSSPHSFASLMEDPDALAENTLAYVEGFSDNIDVFKRFKFADSIAELDEANILYAVASRFAEVDLHPDALSNSEMGDLFEDLIRRFSEASNETAGEFYTPRDAVRLVVDLAIAEDDKLGAEGVPVRTIYDPAAGTGGMLSLAEEHIHAQNPNAALTLYGQELNPESYAICKSDLLMKGHDADNIKWGDTLANDQHQGRTFDFVLANPPYGVDWKKSEKAVRDEAAKGAQGRFSHGLPSVSDGQMLFLCHMASKMRPAKMDGTGGGRVGVVLNGSPLFTGGAESGPSEIRRWLLESDMVEAIVALPTDMFFNTGISTYIWVLDNTKADERRGKVQLIDATGYGTKMRKGLGSKRVEVTDADRATILQTYAAFADTDISKIFDNQDFGYWTITVERPLRLAFDVTDEQVETVVADKKFKGLDADALADTLRAVKGTRYTSRDTFLAAVKHEGDARGLKFPAAQNKALQDLLGERDNTAEICRDRRGAIEPDTKMRDTENIPFGWNGTDKHAQANGTRKAVIDAYMKTEVLPHVPGAWVDHDKTKVGYEIPFTRHFYTYVPPRPLAEIDADLEKVAAEIIEMLREVEA